MLDAPDWTEVVNGNVDVAEDTLRGMVQRSYDALRGIARRLVANDPGAPLAPTALVHETFLRLVDQSRVARQGETFFKRCFARECRRVLLDELRAQRAQKREGAAHKHPLLESASYLGTDRDVEALHVLDALERLAVLSARMTEVVELRVFGGLTIPECAAALGVSARTVSNEWKFACAWLRRELA